MGSVRKILRAYGVESKQSEAHKQNQNPSECHIQEIKGTTRNFIDRSITPRWSWLLCMVYVVSLLKCMAHLSLYWRTPHEAAYVFTPNIMHLMDFELWEPILILDDNTQFLDSRDIFGYYSGPAPSKGALGCSWVWTEEHGLLARSILRHPNIPTDPNRRMVPVSG